MIELKKGQSAIEYLATYGWMLIVIAIAGGTIFTTVQSNTDIQDTSGFDDEEVRVENFGSTDDGLEAEIRAASTNKLKNVNMSITDPETGETVYSDNQKEIEIGETGKISFTNTKQTDNTNTYDVEITYDTGNLEDMTAEGEITGKIDISGESPDSPSSLTVSS